MDPHLEMPWSAIVQGVFAAAFGLWAWVVKTMGSQHIRTLDNIASEVKELRKEFNHEIRDLRIELSGVTARIAVLEHEK